MAIMLNELSNPSRLRAMYEAGTSTTFLSGPGQAKSSTIRTFPKILSELYGEEFGYVEQLLPSVDAPDVRGFVIPTKDEEGRAVAKYTYPTLFPPIEYLQKYQRGVIFLDEFFQADYLVQKAVAPLILERRIGDYQLPEGWWVVCASNRMSDRSGVAKPLMHLVNRTRMMEVELSVDAWLAWAQQNDIHPMGCAFAKHQPGVVFSADVPSDPKPFCTPRSFTSAMKLMKNVAGDSMDLPSDTVTQEMVAGDIGDGAAASFFGYIKVAEFLPSYEEILADPAGAKVPPDHKLDAAFAAQQMVIYHATKAEDYDVLDKVWEYVERLPLELATSTAQQLLENGNAGLLNAPRIAKWMIKHNALVLSSVER